MSALAKKMAAVIATMPSKRYLTYIRSPQWTQTRNKHLASCEGWCEICHKRKACQVHHWTYVRLGYELPQDLCAVCPQCHHDIHCAVMPEPDNDNGPNQLNLPLSG